MGGLTNPSKGRCRRGIILEHAALMLAGVGALVTFALAFAYGILP